MLSLAFVYIDTIVVLGNTIIKDIFEELKVFFLYSLRNQLLFAKYFQRKDIKDFKDIKVLQSLTAFYDPQNNEIITFYFM